MKRLISCFSLMKLGVASFAVSAQVLVGPIRVNGVEVSQQRLTLRCPFFDAETGWDKEDSIWTLHLIDSKKVSGKVPLDVYGRYSVVSKRWYEIVSIDENRIVLGKWQSEYIQEYAVTGRTRGGLYVTKGDRVLGERLRCAELTNYIDRNTLELKLESDSPIDETVVKAGILKKCDGVSAFPRDKTVVSAQCQIVPYQAPPNRIGF